VEAHDAHVTPGELPESIEADPNNIVLSPNEMRALRAATGRPMSDIFTDEADEDAMQAVVWLTLRRAGYRPTWDEAGDVGLRATVAQSDPTPTDTSQTSRLSAISGDTPPGT